MEADTILPSDLKIREAKSDDVIKINALYSKQYGFDKLHEWQWEYEDNPYGKGIVVVAELNNEIIGVNTKICIPLSYGSKDFLAVKGEFGLMEKEYRGRSIFNQIYNKCLDLSKARNIKLLWALSYAEGAYKNIGVPVPGRIGHLLLVLNANEAFREFEQKMFRKEYNQKAFQQWWKFLFRIFLISSQLWSKTIRLKQSAGKKYTIETLTCADDRIDKFWDTFRHQNSCYTITRTSKYLNWRIFNNPNMKYKFLAALENNQIKAYIIIGQKNNVNMAYLTDLCVLDGFEKAAESLLSHAIQCLKLEHIAFVDAWRMGKNPETKKYSKYLTRFGFIPLPAGSPFAVKSLSDEKMLPADPQELDNWFLTEIFSEGVN
jgi:hypothetical protein